MKKNLILASLLIVACGTEGTDNTSNHDLENYKSAAVTGTVAAKPWQLKTAYVTRGLTATEYRVEMFDIEIEPCTLVANPEVRLVKVAFNGEAEETLLNDTYSGLFEYYNSSVKNSEKAEAGKISVGDFGESEVNGKVIVAHNDDYVNGSFTAKRCN